MSNNIMKEAALKYARHGWSVFPCKIDKSPNTRNGFYDATTDLKTIRQWWDKNPNDLICLRTGVVNDLLVIDVDTPRETNSEIDGFETLKQLEQEYGPLPETVCSQTGSGGKHMLFRRPTVSEDAKWHKKIADSVDIKCDGGYIIVPPSSHETGNNYQWINSIYDTEIANAPSWVTDLGLKTEHISSRVSSIQPVRSNTDTSEASAKFQEMLDKLRSTKEGNRNNTLNEVAFRTGILLGKNKLQNADEVISRIYEAARETGLDIKEIMNVLKHSIKDGYQAGRKRIHIPDGYAIRNNGLYCYQKNEQGSNRLIKICSPIEVKALSRDKYGSKWGRLVEFKDNDGNRKTWLMPMKLTHSKKDEIIAHLLEEGLLLEPGKNCPHLLMKYLTSANPQAKIQCVDSIGWHDDRFVLPDVVIGERDEHNSKIVLESYTNKHKFTKQGTLEDWQNHVGKYLPGNSRLTFAVSMAFATPLMYLTDVDSGGFHLHGISSKGKTTVSRVAASVCGDGGRQGYVRSYRATDNALEGLASEHNDCLMVLDEISEIDAQALKKSIYMLANGQGKSRMSKKAKLKEQKHWRLLFLSTGEDTLEDKVRDDHRGGKLHTGQKVRFIDIPADTGTGYGIFEELHGHVDSAKLAEALSTATSKYYGTPLRAFLKKLCQNLESARSEVLQIMREFNELVLPADANGQVVRVGNRFALVAAGGALASRWGIIPCCEKEPVDAARTCFEKWMNERGGSQEDELTTGIRKLRDHLLEFGSSKYQDISDDISRWPTQRLGYKKKVMKQDHEYRYEYYIFPQTMWDILDSKTIGHLVVAELARRRHIDASNSGGYTKNKRLPGLGQTCVYHVNAEFLEVHAGGKQVSNGEECEGCEGESTEDQRACKEPLCLTAVHW